MILYEAKRTSAFLAGLLSGVMLMGCAGAAFAAASGSVRFGAMGLAINAKTVITAGETVKDAKGCEIPSTIVYTNELGGDTTYLPIRKISELMDIPVSYQDGMVYLGYTPASGDSVSIGTLGDDEVWAKRSLHQAGAKAGPYTELEPYWPTEEEITGWSVRDAVLSGGPTVGDTYYPLGGEGYCAISVTNTPTGIWSSIYTVPLPSPETSSPPPSFLRVRQSSIPSTPRRIPVGCTSGASASPWAVSPLSAAAPSILLSAQK